MMLRIIEILYRIAGYDVDSCEWCHPPHSTKMRRIRRQTERD